MLDYDLDKMLFRIPAEKHSAKEITEILEDHPEVQFVSLVGIDIGGHDTDEKIPVKLFLEDVYKRQIKVYLFCLLCLAGRITVQIPIKFFNVNSLLRFIVCRVLTSL